MLDSPPLLGPGPRGYNLGSTPTPNPPLRGMLPSQVLFVSCLAKKARNSDFSVPRTARARQRFFLINTSTTRQVVPGFFLLSQPQKLSSLLSGTSSLCQNTSVCVVQVFLPLKRLQSVQGCSLFGVHVLWFVPEPHVIVGHMLVRRQVPSRV